MDDVVVDEGNNRLISIKGVAFKDLRVPHLREFCKHNSIQSHQSQSKGRLDEMIVMRYKHKDKESMMYGENKQPASSKKKKKKKPPKTQVEGVTLEGTYYRAINVYYDQGVKHLKLAVCSLLSLFASTLCLLCWNFLEC